MNQQTFFSGKHNSRNMDKSEEKEADDVQKSEEVKELAQNQQEHQIEKALDSILEYANCIKNFMGLIVDKNGDSESACQNEGVLSPNDGTENSKNVEMLTNGESVVKERGGGKKIKQANCSDSNEENVILSSDYEKQDEFHSNVGDEVDNNIPVKSTLTSDNCASTINQLVINESHSDRSENVQNQKHTTTKSSDNIKSSSTEETANKILEVDDLSNFNNYCHQKKSQCRVPAYLYELKNLQDEKALCESNTVSCEEKNYKETTENHIDVPVVDMDPETVCGFGCFKPQWLQTYATARTYLVFYSIVGVLQGSYFTYVIGTMTTMEKRYAFKSKISGVIMMLDEVTPLFLGVLVGYFGGKAHRPRIVALGMFMSALCCFISALPYFVYGTSKHLVASYVKNDTAVEYCDREVKYEQCETDDRPPTLSAVACLFLGSFLKGFGNLAYYAVGLAYMDDNAKKKNTPVYFAISSALRMLGPIIGFLMSSAFLKFYENPFEDPGYGPEDPRWIGAWWLGFVLQGILLFIFSFPILLFPKRLPRQRKRAFSNTANFDSETNAERLRGLITAVTRLLMNPVFTCHTFATIFSLISGYGYYTMLPKYLEVQFRVSASSASLLTGPPCLIACAIMLLLGGFGIYKFKPRVKTLIACQGLTELGWVIGALLLMLPTCRNVLLTGSTLTEDGLQLENDCNTDCLCTTVAFNPVCGPDGVSNYFSPCHAGCSIGNISDLKSIGNCSCVHSSNGSFIVSDIVDRGICAVEDCWNKVVIYVTILTVLSGVLGTFRVAHIMILLRCIEPQDKSLALGLFEALICCLAFVPLPLIFGALADAACLIWEKSCGATGNCWFYDVDRFNYLLHGTSSMFSILSVICYIIVISMSQRVRDLYEDDDSEFEPTKSNEKISFKSSIAKRQSS